MTTSKKNCAIEFSIADFPGYAEAVARENAIRGAACLGSNEVICGLEVKPLCAAHVRLLVLVRSPFLGQFTVAQLAGTPGKDFEDGKPDILDDIMRFLWIVSPMYETGSRAGTPPKRRWFDTRQRFKRRLEAARTPRDKFNTAFSAILKQPVTTVVQEILDYVDEAYTDAEDDGEPGEKSHYAFEISIAHEFAKHYGYRIDFWDSTCPADKNPILVPLKIVFQLRKLRMKADGGESIVTNKSDRLIAAGLEKISARN